VINKVIDGEDYLERITWHVQKNDFEGTNRVTYGNITGTVSVAQDNDSTWCLAEQVLITLE